MYQEWRKKYGNKQPTAQVGICPTYMLRLETELRRML